MGMRLAGLYSRAHEHSVTGMALQGVILRYPRTMFSCVTLDVEADMYSDIVDIAETLH